MEISLLSQAFNIQGITKVEPPQAHMFQRQAPSREEHVLIDMVGSI